jgi:hypothetical protein
MQQLNETWDKFIDMATVKPQYLLYATTFTVGAYLADEWYQRYNADSDIRTIIQKVASKDSKEIKEGIKGLIQYSKDAEKKEIALEHGAIRAIFSLLKSSDLADLHEYALDALNSVLDNTAEARDEVVSNNGIDLLVSQLLTKYRVKACDLLLRATVFDTVAQILPDDIPFGSEGGLAMSKLSDEKFQLLFNVFTEGKLETLPLITRIFANGCYTNAFAKRLSEKDNGVIVTAMMSNIVTGSKQPRVKVDSLMILAGVANVNFVEFALIYLTGVNPEKILGNVVEKEAEVAVLDIFLAFLTHSDKKEDLNKIGDILARHQAWTKKLFGLLEEKQDKIKNKAHHLLNLVDDLPEEYSENITLFATEERARIKKVREAEEKKKDEDMQRQLRAMGMGGMF